MASQADEPHYYGKDSTPSSSPSPSPCDAASPHHPLFIKGDFTSPDSITAQTGHVTDPATSATTCHCLGYAQPQALPTWTRDKEMSWQEMRTCEEPRHQHLHHHHYHHHHHHHHGQLYQWPAAAVYCAASGLSSLSSSAPSHTHTQYTHTASTSPSLSHTQHTHTSTPSLSHTAVHTHCPQLDKYTHTTPSTYHLRDYTHTYITQQHTHIPPSSDDLYTIPSLPLKKPTRPKRQIKLLIPPFPSPCAPPYIICQHCSQLLSLPSSPPPHMTHASVLKLKCALCMGTNFFSTPHRRPSLSSTPSDHAAQHCARVTVSESAVNIAGGDFQFKVEHRSIQADVPPIVSSTDGGFDLKTEPKSTSADVPAGVGLLTDDGLQVKVERTIKCMDTHVPTDENLTHNMPTKGTCSPNCEESPQSPSKLNPEFAGFSSVQDWINSLEQYSFSHCPTSAIGAGFGSDLQLDWSGNFVPPVPGSPLHEHFGYKSPTELLHKTLSSDDEIKVRSDTNSSASTSATSANTFKPPGFDNVGEPVHQNHPNECTAAAAKKQGSKSSTRSTTQADLQDDQSSLVSLFKRSFKSFGERRSPSMSSPKSRVIVNGHSLSQPALKRAEKRAGKLRPGTYWYDSKAGFWGITGGPCLGVLPPFIEELHYPMAGDCSNGDTQVFVNGRELHHIDLALLAHRGLSRKLGRSYVIGFDGIVIEETTGQELKHLGKLAPTVDQRGIGFGMYMARLQS